MTEDPGPDRSIAVEAFGVGVEIIAADRHIGAIRRLLPPGSRPVSAPSEHGRFELVPAGRDGLLDVLCDGVSVAGGLDMHVALGVLDAQVRAHIALHAPDHIFVHAGVVGVGDQAMILPGMSFAGKTTLVAELVGMGAEYWSDEFAALDSDGLVHPYPKPLSVRNTHLVAEDRAPETLGGRVGDRPLPVHLVALARYRPGASWAPVRRSPGHGAIKLLEHTVPARSRPEQALRAVRVATAGAVILEGERGEARETASALLATIAG